MIKIITPRGTFEVEEILSYPNFIEIQTVIENLHKEGYYYWFTNYTNNNKLAQHIYIKQGQLNPQYKVLNEVLE